MANTERVAPLEVLDRLREAVNDHDLDALVACFSDSYVNETPAHPGRGFHGLDQVRRNWSQIFAGVPNISARTLRTALDGDTLWSEWEMSGRRADGAQFLMRGVVIFSIAGSTIASARFYLEPVEDQSGTADDHARRVSGAQAKEPS